MIFNCELSVQNMGNTLSNFFLSREQEGPNLSEQFKNEIFSKLRNDYPHGATRHSPVHKDFCKKIDYALRSQNHYGIFGFELMLFVKSLYGTNKEYLNEISPSLKILDANSVLSVKALNDIVLEYAYPKFNQGIGNVNIQNISFYERLLLQMSLPRVSKCHIQNAKTILLIPDEKNIGAMSQDQLNQVIIKIKRIHKELIGENTDQRRRSNDVELMSDSRGRAIITDETEQFTLDAMSNILVHTQSIKTLKIRLQYITEEQTHDIANMIRDTTSLTKLDLNCNLVSMGCSATAPKAHNTAIGIFVAVQVFTALINAEVLGLGGVYNLLLICFMQSLSISALLWSSCVSRYYLPDGDSKLKILTEAITESTTLKDLTIGCDDILFYHTMTIRNEDNKRIGLQGVKHIAQMIKDNESLKTLSLKLNLCFEPNLCEYFLGACVPFQGLKIIASALPHNTSLKTLNLHDDVRKMGTKYLIKFLQDNTTALTNIGGVHSREIYEILERNSESKSNLPPVQEVAIDIKIREELFYAPGDYDEKIAVNEIEALGMNNI